MTRSLLMLGGSPHQLIAIETAKRLGYRTVLCDYLPDNPGQFIADVYYPVSTTDRDAVIEVARKECVEGVLAYATDPASPIAAAVAEELGLPTNPLSAVETMSQKHLFREHLKQQGFPCPASMAFSAKDDLEKTWESLQSFTLPIVVKPTDSSGSKGVSIVEDQASFVLAVEAADKINNNGVLIAEEYIEKEYPCVIGGDIFVIDGEVRFWGLMDCMRDTAVELVPTGKKTPTNLSAEQKRSIKDALQRLVRTLGIRFGEMNVEVILGRENTPYIIELGSRAGGNMIPVQLSDASGIDLVEANVLCAMGETPENLDYDLSHDAYATHVLHSLQDGIFDGIEIDEVLSPSVYRTILYEQEGEQIESFDGANKALGIIFMRFDSLQQMNDNMADVNEHIHVLVR